MDLTKKVIYSSGLVVVISAVVFQTIQYCGVNELANIQWKFSKNGINYTSAFQTQYG